MTRCKTMKEYEQLALTRMTGEQVANELTPEERKHYYAMMSGEEEEEE